MTIIERIKKLATRSQSLEKASNEKDFHYDFKKMEVEWDEMSAEMEAINKAAGKGLQVGRCLRFGVADGTACYIITKIRKNDVVVEWIPFWDNYFSDAIGLTSNKTAWVVNRTTAERHCGMRDLFKEGSH